MTQLRLNVIHPVINSDTQKPSTALLRSRPPLDMEINFEYLKTGPEVIETESDARQALTGILDIARSAESDGYDCCIIDCMDDPGLIAVRDEIGIPAFGMGEVTLHAGLMLNKDVAILAPDERSVPSLRKMVSDAGIPESMVGIQTLDLSVGAIRTNKTKTIERLWHEANKAASAGYQIVIPGCTDISAYLDTPTSREYENNIDVHLFDPVETTVWAAAILCALTRKNAENHSTNQ